MPRDIKLKKVNKNIKAFDRGAALADKLKSGTSKLKNTAEEAGQPKNYSSDEYAIDKSSENAEKAVQQAAHQAKTLGTNTVNKIKQARQNHKIKKANTPFSETGVPSQSSSGTSPRKIRVKTSDALKNNSKVKSTTLDRTVRKPHGKTSASNIKSRKVTSNNINPSSPRTHSLNVAEKAKTRFFDSNNKAFKSVKNTSSKPIKQITHAKKQTSYTVKTAKGSGKAVKNTANAIKKANTTVKTAVKAPKKAAKATARAAKTTKNTAKAAARLSKQAAKTAKALLKATLQALKAIAAGIKSLVMAIAAAGSAALPVILIVAVVAVILFSGFGIFMANENTEGYTMAEVISALNQDFNAKITKIKADNPHDEAKLTGRKPSWQEVLAVYAIKVNTDPDNPMEVTAIDDHKLNIIKDIFWDMTEISHKMQQKQEQVPVTTEPTEPTTRPTQPSTTNPPNTNPTTQTTTKKTEPPIITKKILHININTKSIDEIMDKYSFSASQREQVMQLLNKDMEELWQMLLNGLGGGGSVNGGTIVEIAENEYRNYLESGSFGGSKYISWYNSRYGTGFSYDTSWCAIFVSWCADQGGYLDSGVMYASAGAGNHPREFYASRGQWHKQGTYSPKPGDIILFRWDSSGYNDQYHSDHIGFVVEVSDGYVYTIEGNASDRIKRLAYPINSANINGYCTPDY